MSAILRDIHREFGLKSRLAAPLLGRYLLMALRAKTSASAGSDMGAAHLL